MRTLPVLAALAGLALSAPAEAADPIAGRWVTQDKDAVVTIGRCGDGYCGRITKFLVTPPGGAGQRDIHNPDPAKRDRKVLGIAVLHSFHEESDLWRGEIYDPKTGKTYRSVVRRKSASRLEVKGCIGPFCQTQNWSRTR